MKIQTKLNKVQSSQIDDLINATGLDLNTIVRVALHEYYQRQKGSIASITSFQSIPEIIPAKPAERLDISTPLDDKQQAMANKLSWSEWSALNPGKSNDEFLQYFLAKDNLLG